MIITRIRYEMRKKGLDSHLNLRIFTGVYFTHGFFSPINLRSPFINGTKTNTALTMKKKNSEVSVKAGLYNYRIFIAIDSYWQVNSRINTQKDFNLKILCNDNPHGPKIEPRRLAVKNTHRYTNKLLYSKFKILRKTFTAFLDKRSIAPRKHKVRQKIFN